MKKSILKGIAAFVVLAAVTMFFLCSCRAEMNFKIDSKGLLSMTAGGNTEIAPSPLGQIVVDNTILAPLSAKVSSDKVILNFEQGDVVLSKTLRPNGSLRLEVVEIPDDIDTFFFGPYECPATVKVGYMVGACWHEDGSLVCIQALNPKTHGSLMGHKTLEKGECPYVNASGFTYPGSAPAALSEGKYVLTCHAENFTRPRVVERVHYGLKNVTVDSIPAPEGSIVGSAIILTRADSAESMLADINNIEIEEGLPHPTIDGIWSKISPRAKEMYFDFGGGDMEEQLRIIEKAGVKWIYFSNPFESWGHFNVNPRIYPGGDATFLKAADNARSHGADIGMHTLSNFINTNDEYVTPVPHKDLLAFDPTPIKNDLGIADTEIFIGEELNYAVKQNMAVVRLGDELIRFDHFDAGRMCLTGCKRGAFGTIAAEHPAGTILTHVQDHGYGTLFPNYSLLNEMAGNVAGFINKFGMKRMSFDGLEGCFNEGHGELGVNTYVKDVFDQIEGHSIITDASMNTNFVWHALTYFNWGEPFYDSDRRGGQPNYRARNVDIFHNNLMPGMLGWYLVANSDRVFEPTLPETLEYILSRSIAYDAGLCISWRIGESDKGDSFLKMIREWNDFRASVDVPAEIRQIMKNEKSNWHLEKKGDKWLLSQMAVEEFDMRFTDRMQTVIQKESGTNTDNPWAHSGKFHLSNCVLDRTSIDESIAPVVEPGHFRVRVGNPTEKGQLNGLALCGGWYGGEILSFKVTADAGDYLEYCGDMKLYHYDKNYNLIETVEGKGRPIITDGGLYHGVTFKYTLTNDDLAMNMKAIRTIRTFEF